MYGFSSLNVQIGQSCVTFSKYSKRGDLNDISKSRHSSQGSAKAVRVINNSDRSIRGTERAPLLSMPPSPSCFKVSIHNKKQNLHSLPFVYMLQHSANIIQGSTHSFKLPYFRNTPCLNVNCFHDLNVKITDSMSILNVNTLKKSMSMSPFIVLVMSGPLRGLKFL